MVATLVVTLALALPAAKAPAANGLRGQVWEGPTTPVCRTDVPCDRPAVGVVLYFSRNGARVRAVKTDANGWYTAPLPPATYTVKSSRGIRRTPFPTHVKVRPGHVDRLDFHIDTGIR